MNCPNCGGTVQPGSTRCVKCGSYVDQPAAQQPAQPGQQPVQQPVALASPKSKIAAGLLGIFFGSLGVHRFYLGYTGLGVALLMLTIMGWVLSFFCIGIPMVIGAWLWGLIEGILILAGVINKDAQGNLLQ